MEERMDVVTEYWARPWTLSQLEEFIRTARNHWFDDNCSLSLESDGIYVSRRESSTAMQHTQDQLPFEQIEFKHQPSDYDWPSKDRRKRERTMDDAWEDWRDGLAYR